MNDKNNMLALSQERFSARKFTPEAVSQEDLDYIMECVRLAPSAVNRQGSLGAGSLCAQKRRRRNCRIATTANGSRRLLYIL